ncbi:hypothetical protein [Novosphingobium sp. MD-1]|uniref:hypothetical protein n=1 Tax=Novosphingobium sp. MD-1 TaxID=1630648 RepID=UPI00061BBDE8|nr:hypothetical protein [Novosphingobium sp. MD-1]GAO54944.1 hypothetical protein NMD1_02046 [Novosphingobium sp. MD-1]
MIAAQADFAALLARLTRKADAIAQARAAQRAQGASPRRWRSARLLWPLFGQE